MLRTAIALCLLACGTDPPEEPFHPPPGEAQVEEEYAYEAAQWRVEWLEVSARTVHVDEPTADQIAAYAGAHHSELEAAYAREPGRFENLPPMVHLRHIALFVADGASPEQRAAVRGQVEALRALAIGGQDFATLAHEHSADRTSPNGDLGWIRRGVEDPAIEEAAFALEHDGDISAVVETERAIRVVQRIARHEGGNLPRDAAMLELAAPMMRTEQIAAATEPVAERAAALFREGRTTEEVARTIGADRGTDGLATGDRIIRHDTAPNEAFPAGTSERIVAVESSTPVVLPVAHNDSGSAYAIRVRTVPSVPDGLTAEVRSCLRTRASHHCARGDYESEPCERCLPSPPERGGWQDTLSQDQLDDLRDLLIQTGEPR